MSYAVRQTRNLAKHEHLHEPDQPVDVASFALPDATAQPTVTVERAAAILGISRGVAYDAARRGLIPTLRIGHRVLVPTARLAALLNDSGSRRPPD